MNETSKCYARRVIDGDFEIFLKGRIIDIGCGPDPLVLPAKPTLSGSDQFGDGPSIPFQQYEGGGTVWRWDMEQGPAERMAGAPDTTFDTVYSSHCLEHMTSVELALTNWVRILKPGGFLYVIVPDFYYYEKRDWPSRYNSDHKHSFSQSIPRYVAKRNNHWNMSADVRPLLVKLGCQMVFDELEVDGYDYNLDFNVDQTRGDALCQIRFVAQKQ